MDKMDLGEWLAYMGQLFPDHEDGYMLALIAFAVYLPVLFWLTWAIGKHWQRAITVALVPPAVLVFCYSDLFPSELADHRLIWTWALMWVALAVMLTAHLTSANDTEDGFYLSFPVSLGLAVLMGLPGTGLAIIVSAGVPLYLFRRYSNDSRRIAVEKAEADKVPFRLYRPPVMNWVYAICFPLVTLAGAALINAREDYTWSYGIVLLPLALMSAAWIRSLINPDYRSVLVEEDAITIGYPVQTLKISLHRVRHFFPAGYGARDQILLDYVDRPRTIWLSLGYGVPAEPELIDKLNELAAAARAAKGLDKVRIDASEQRAKDTADTAGVSAEMGESA
ncbi:MAG: hypothetical protein Alpg2KO_12290 [Alphaproteobacteria bacterium]